jgi:hypothetical protein
MAGTPYPVDSNVLLRWVNPDDRDYPLVVSAIDATLPRGAVFATRLRMLLNSETLVLVHLTAMGTPNLLISPVYAQKNPPRSAFSFAVCLLPL